MQMELQYGNYTPEGFWQKNPEGLFFRGVIYAEQFGKVGRSAVVQDAWLRVVAGWGKCKYTAWFDVADGVGVSNTGERWSNEPERDWAIVPDGARIIRVEGWREHPNVIVSAGVVPLGR